MGVMGAEGVEAQQHEHAPLHACACAQVVGTFQSYHQAPPATVISFLQQPAQQATFVANAENIPTRYFFSHPTITQQLQNGALPFH
jgi:hypothetical protein